MHRRAAIASKTVWWMMYQFGQCGIETRTVRGWEVDSHKTNQRQWANGEKIAPSKNHWRATFYWNSINWIEKPIEHEIQIASCFCVLALLPSSNLNHLKLHKSSIYVTNFDAICLRANFFVRVYCLEFVIWLWWTHTIPVPGTFCFFKLNCTWNSNFFSDFDLNAMNIPIFQFIGMRSTKN